MRTQVLPASSERSTATPSCVAETRPVWKTAG